ncbi:SMP-30/gluconolactonase/LRE family protein [Falsiroseomonas tokyonensis]|uniref:SMP-30/gluconolactonase/LRE family protein n=1 Tax=Falsiroseomonas tokyonensis TaxID=430521 RepID=A0ABV7BX38_9PROT|nr:SMP-30/gluconolactonase/LRE family protein [Falsiroseomonas tokyonensis]MBU8538616.1 SMP-30/gluconolactonase/LRE family protein [Falsiroseomonas tokyonensis]
MISERRQLLRGLGSAALFAATPALAQREAPQGRYPDPAVEVLDPSFNRYRLALAAVERLATGFRWSEGPVWFGDQRCLIWSDIPNNRLMRWHEGDGRVDVFREPANNPNGNTRDRQGRLITCEHLTRRVTRTELDGRITVLADSFDGKKLNSPNDVVVKSDGSIWFTDPPFGVLGFYEGEMAQPELPTNIYRIDGTSGQVTLASGDVGRPNGLAFSPDERILYVVEAAASPRVIRAFDVGEGGRLSNNRIFFQCKDGETPDGFRLDVDGNLWCGWGMGTPELDGVRVINKDGVPIGHIHLPERCANVTFGGRHRNRLFMPASRSLYSLYVNTQGIAYG